MCKGSGVQKSILLVSLGYYYGWTAMPVMRQQLHCAVQLNPCSGGHDYHAESTLHKINALYKKITETSSN